MKDLSDEDLEKNLKEKYDELNVPDKFFDTSRVFKRYDEEKKNKKKKNTYIAASIIVLLLIISVSVVVFVNNDKGSKVEQAENIVNNEENTEKNETVKITGKITVKKVSSISETGKMSNVSTLKVEDILGYEIINKVPYTKVKAKVINNYYGNEDEIEFYVPGGVFKVKDIKDNIDNIDENEISKYNLEDNVYVSYYDEYYISKPEVNNIYLATICLKEEDNNYYINENSEYGFISYDKDNNTVVLKDGTEEKVEMDKYIDSFTK